MKSIFYSMTIVAALNASTLLISQAGAQLPLNLNRTARGAAGATQRARAQVQQRVRAQTQQRIQADVQQRIQAQTQTRIRAQARQRAQSQARLRLPKAGSLRLKAGGNARLDAESRGKAGSAGAGATGESNSKASAKTGIPVSLTAKEMSDLDVVFGDFNPFRRRDEAGPGGKKQSKPAARGRVVLAANDESSAEVRSEGRTENSARAGIGPARLWFDSETEFQATILAAVRQRRAEISAMRDHALAEANARLMAQADRLETMLDAYVAAEAKANASAQSAINRNPLRNRPGQTVIQAGAEGETDVNVTTPAPSENTDNDDLTPN